MDHFIIEGGKPIQGDIEVLAAKNAVLPILAASILAESGTTTLHNVPMTQDILMMLKLLESLGMIIHKNSDERTVTLDSSSVMNYRAEYDLVRKMRASFLVMGPLLARFGVAQVSQPGGCAIGARPVNWHLRGFEELGTKVEEHKGYLDATVDKLRGATIYFDRPSHTGTENIMMAAVEAEGRTTIVNSSMEPEVEDLANFLNLMGAQIKGAGTPIIEIDGVRSLKGVDYTPIGDRLEAGTYLFAVAAAKGDVLIKGIHHRHLMMTLKKLSEMGCSIDYPDDSSIRIIMNDKVKSLEIITAPYPGFPTDLQPMIVASLATARGTSYVRETIFENRFLHLMELSRLGADVSVDGEQATIRGVEHLNGAEVMASDIRAGAGLVIAGLAAKGRTVVRRVYHIDRGYEHLERRFSSLGADIRRVSE